MATNQKRIPQCIGVFTNPSAGGTTSLTVSLNSANTWLALSFVPDTGKSLTEVRLFIKTKTGTIGANDLTCEIYADSAGNPGSSIAGPINTISPAAAANTWVAFTFTAFALTAGTQYWIILKNANATPASNFVAWNFLNNQAVAPWVNGGQNFGWIKQHTTDGGSTWVSQIRPGAGWRIGYSDGTYDGLVGDKPLEGGSAIGAYLTREVGATFVTPAGATLNVRGISFLVFRTGTPTGALRYRLYNGTTLLATTNSIPVANVVNLDWHAAYFSANQAIAPGTTLRVTMGVASGGDTSNFFSMNGVDIDNTAASKQLDPFGTVANPTNQVKQTYFDGTTWTDTDTTVPYFALLLDSEGEFG